MCVSGLFNPAPSDSVIYRLQHLSPVSFDAVSVGYRDAQLDRRQSRDGPIHSAALRNSR